MHHRCICGSNSQVKVVAVREMMYGTEDMFRYLECGECGTLRIAVEVGDLEGYYPADYYSFGEIASCQSLLATRWLRRFRSHVLRNVPFAVKVLPKRFTPTWFRWFATLRVPLSASVLDVGSGSGQHLMAMWRDGFRNLDGIDAYIPHDLDLNHEVRIRRITLDDVEGEYDVVMFHHSLEHVLNPIETLDCAIGKLGKSGILIIRVPVADSYAYRHYQSNWVQIDAPRHQVIPTTRGLTQLVESMGLTLVNLYRDSTGFQFWGSELYLNGLSLVPNASELSRQFSEAELDIFERRSIIMNRRNDGDQAVLVFRKP